jgi:hypothetical protein
VLEGADDLRCIDAAEAATRRCRITVGTGRTIMALRINIDPTYGDKNVFPPVEQVDANPVESGYEVTLSTRIEGQLTPIVIKLTDSQARDLSKLLSAKPRQA